MIRSLLAALAVVTGMLTLGADLAHTAYTATQTASLIVLPPA